MSDQGYLYVLANSAMPGLAKIGKTTRTPSERAEELSGVTGLPTPFIVVFEQLFSDCSSAERHVHAALESRGFRVAANREFFNAPVNEIVRAVIAAPGAIDEFANSPVNGSDNEEDSLIDNAPVWQHIWEEAEETYYGLGEVLQDYESALVLYKQAVRLGCLEAYGMAGYMCEHGEGAAVSISQALSYYRDGAREGSHYCYWRLACHYYQEENTSSMEKCLKNFFAGYPQDLSTIESQKVHQDASSMIFDYYIMRTEPPEGLRKAFTLMRDGIEVMAEKTRKHFEERGNFALVDRFRCIAEYCQGL
jgi:hypothetical protein